MAPTRTAPVTIPQGDLGELLSDLMGQTGKLMEALGGYRIRICHSGMFPWARVLKELLYRGFQVYVTAHKADMYIEAKP
jgi:hypothetical protein